MTTRGRVLMGMALVGTMLLGTGCSQSRSSLGDLQRYMTGTFSSAEQHQADPKNYFHIVLHMQPIWESRDDGPWLYVEQAVAAMPERPYRQRVYHLTDNGDGSYSSAVYDLPGEALSYAGAHQDPELLSDVSPDDLLLREGCTLTLRRGPDGCFEGETHEDDCQSSFRGATYVTSEARIEPTRLVTWDRGYDASGKQVWGATKGGYIFAREDD